MLFFIQDMFPFCDKKHFSSMYSSCCTVFQTFFASKCFQKGEKKALIMFFIHIIDKYY